MKRKLSAWLLACASILWGCAEKGTGPETPENPEDNSEYVCDGPFSIEVSDLHASTFKITVTPENLSEPYYCGVATVDFLNTFDTDGDTKTAIENFIDAEVLSNPEIVIAEILKKGTHTREVTGLSPQQEFVAFACGMDEDGNIFTEISAIKGKTAELKESDMTFEIEIEQVTATNAMLFISPSENEPYVWMELPEDLYEGKTDKEIEDFLMRYYKPFFPSRSQSGELAYSFKDNLEPETGYMVIVFGYDGGITTPLTTVEFRTKQPGNPEDVTFTFEYGAMTSHSTYVTITPSDVSVSYLAIVADEDTLEEYGGADEEGVLALIDDYIGFAIRTGEAKDRAEFTRDYSQRGIKTGSFGLTPGKKHYTCVVCVDKEGNFASDVTMDMFTAPEENATTASVSADFDRFFDGDELASLDSEAYGEYAGWAVLPIEFTLNDDAAAALYTVYPADLLEEEGATEEEIRSLMLDETLIGDFTFFAEERVDIQLEWGVEYKMFMLAFDEAENASGLITVDIPALSKEDASDASEYEPME